MCLKMLGILKRQGVQGPHQLLLALADERQHGLGDHEGTQHIHPVYIYDVLY